MPDRSHALLARFMLPLPDACIAAQIAPSCAVNTGLFVLPELPRGVLPAELRQLLAYVPSVHQGCLQPQAIIRVRTAVGCLL